MKRDVRGEGVQQSLLIHNKNRIKSIQVNIRVDERFKKIILASAKYLKKIKMFDWWKSKLINAQNKKLK